MSLSVGISRFECLFNTQRLVKCRLKGTLNQVWIFILMRPFTQGNLLVLLLKGQVLILSIHVCVVVHVHVALEIEKLIIFAWSSFAANFPQQTPFVVFVGSPTHI